jgi:hypothetical protein
LVFGKRAEVKKGKTYFKIAVTECENRREFHTERQTDMDTEWM